MSDAVPIEVTITVGSRQGSVILVADPSDALTAVQIGRAVSEWVLRAGGSEASVIVGVSDE